MNYSFPSGGKTCDVTFRLLCKYLATRPIYIPVMPLALSLLMCYDVASLRLVHGVRPLLGGSGVLFSVYMFWSYTNRCVLPQGCSIMFYGSCVRGGGGVLFS